MFWHRFFSPHTDTIRAVAIIPITLITALGMACGLTACSMNNSNGPGPSAWKFSQALENKNFHQACQETTAPQECEKALPLAFSGLHAHSVELKIGQVHTQGSSSWVAYYYKWHFLHAPTFSYEGKFRYALHNKIWKMRWSAQNIHPQLGRGQNVLKKPIVPESSALNSFQSGAIMKPAVDTRISFDPQSLDPDTAHAVAQQLVYVFLQYNHQLNVNSLLTTSHKSIIAQVSPADIKRSQRIRSAMRLPGVTLDDMRVWRSYAPHYKGFLEPILRKITINHQNGSPGWEIVSVDNSGNIVQILDSKAPQANTAPTVTLVDKIQAAAFHAVNIRQDKPVMLVAIQPSTGHIVAVAENHPASTMGTPALNGLFPPGSTFKIITASASLRTGLADSQTIIPCPGTVTVAQRVIPNENRFALGNVPMQTAFAQSCNTSFAWLASRMGPYDLFRTAGELGIGVDFKIPGLSTVTGKIVPTANIVERTEDGFGQGKDLVSPLGMAIVAASVAHGARISPEFIVHQPTKDIHIPEGIGSGFLDRKQLAQLRRMMREVVLSGTATMISSEGQVYGKTGEAEYNGGSHAWFAGYRGDLAFATLIVSGGSSNAAVNLTKIFLGGLD